MISLNDITVKDSLTRLISTADITLKLVGPVNNRAHLLDRKPCFAQGSLPKKIFSVTLRYNDNNTVISNKYSTIS